MKTFTLLAAAAALAFPASAFAADMVVLKDAGAGQWLPGPPTLPKGTQMLPVVGDPAKPGPFVIRFKFPKSSDIPPHTHSADENVTVLSGSIWHAMGEKFDKAKGTDLHTGGFVYLPANMSHYLWTTTEPVEVQVTGTGPFGLQFVNPADDPSKKS